MRRETLLTLGRWIAGPQLLNAIESVAARVRFGSSLSGRPSRGAPIPKPSPAQFKGPVRWLLGPQLLTALKSIALFTASRGKLDSRDWMRTTELHIPAVEGEDEFWFDYIADTGDGQTATYSIAYLCLKSIEVTLPESQQRATLPRGSFLYVGGDTAYHVADHATLAFRFQSPFAWACNDLAETNDPGFCKDRRPIFAIPGNHDYYDEIDGFNRQFIKPMQEESQRSSKGTLPQLSIPGFKRIQTASYAALDLPFGWKLWALDCESGNLDARQREFFRHLAPGSPDKLILLTSRPSTFCGRRARVKDPVTTACKDLGIETPFLESKPDPLDGRKCRLDLAGDIHHYARYWGPVADASPAPSARNYASVVSGMGGAFLHPSQTNAGEIESQKVYPLPGVSRTAVAERLFSLLTIASGGYVCALTAIIALVLYFGATLSTTAKPVIDDILQRFSIAPRTYALAARLPAIASTVVFPSMVLAIWRVLWPPLTLLILMVAIVCYSRVVSFMQTGDAQNPRYWFFRGWPPLLITAAVLGLSLWNIAPAEIPPFANAILIFVALVAGALALTESFFFSEWLNRRPIEKVTDLLPASRYIPNWAMLIVAAFIIGYSFFSFGRLSAFSLVSDLTMIAVVVSVVLGLALLGAAIGGFLHGLKGKSLFLLLGLWHAVLQLICPFLLTRMENIWVLPVIVVVAFVFNSLGYILMKHDFRKLLAVTWIVLGMAFIVVPASLTDSLRQSSGSLANHPWWQFFFAGTFGLLMGCLWFGWYLAVSLSFDGHNNEAGGAARVEEYKQLMRIRLRPDRLEAYVIGIDKIEADGSLLKPHLIEHFVLQPTAPSPSA